MPGQRLLWSGPLFQELFLTEDVCSLPDGSMSGIRRKKRPNFSGRTDPFCIWQDFMSCFKKFQDLSFLRLRQIRLSVRSTIACLWSWRKRSWKNGYGKIVQWKNSWKKLPDFWSADRNTVRRDCFFYKRTSKREKLRIWKLLLFYDLPGVSGMDKALQGFNLTKKYRNATLNLIYRPCLWL